MTQTVKKAQAIVLSMLLCCNCLAVCTCLTVYLLFLQSIITPPLPDGHFCPPSTSVDWSNSDPTPYVSCRGFLGLLKMISLVLQTPILSDFVRTLAVTLFFTALTSMFTHLQNLKVTLDELNYILSLNYLSHLIHHHLSKFSSLKL